MNDAPLYKTLKIVKSADSDETVACANVEACPSRHWSVPKVHITSIVCNAIQYNTIQYSYSALNLGQFPCFCCRLLTSFFSKLTFSNGLGPEQGCPSVGLDLEPNCLQRLSADDKSRRQQGKS